MKKSNKQWTIRLGALALTALCLGTGAALAAGGDQSDPLVTLSYLNETAIPQVVKQVESSTATRQAELQQSFQSQINQDLLQAGQGGQGGGSRAVGPEIRVTSAPRSMAILAMA